MKSKTVNQIGLFLIVCSLFSITSFGMSKVEQKEKRNVGTFNSIGLAISADLYLKQGSNREVVIEAGEDMLEKIITEVKNGKLIVRYDTRKYFKYPRVKVYITSPEINGLSISSSGDIIAETAIKANEIDLSISGSGEIHIDVLDANKATVGISGSGNIFLGGTNTLDDLELAISGSGDLEADKLKTENFNGRISGSGSCRISVSSTLYAKISGSGKIYYTGNPQIDASISGSGKVISIK